MKEKERHVFAGLLVVLLLAISSPFLISIRYSTFGGLFIRMQGLFWYFDNQLEHTTFGIVGLWEIVQYLPFMSLRPFGVYQMYRYYKQKASSFSLFIVGLLGEFPPLLAALSLAPLLLTSIYLGPLPIHLVVGYVIIKLKPRPKIAVPWQDTPD
jgi:hypothetical protein